MESLELLLLLQALEFQANQTSEEVVVAVREVEAGSLHLEGAYEANKSVCYIVRSIFVLNTQHTQYTQHTKQYT